MSCRASALAHKFSRVAVAIASVVHHPRARCRRGVGGTSISAAARTTLVMPPPSHQRYRRLLVGNFGQIRDDPLYHSNAVIDIGSQCAPVECSAFGRSHWSVGSKTSSKLDRGIHDVVIRVRLCWKRRLRVDHDIMDSRPVRLTGDGAVGFRTVI